MIFFDVGQGDALLIRTPQGDVLVDAGPDDAQATLCRKLKSLGVKELALAVFTHPDEDHIGGADGVISEFSVKEIWLPPNNADGEAYERLLVAAKETQSNVRYVTKNERFSIGGVYLFVLSPFLGMEEDPNNSSIVLKLTYENTSALLAGDVETKLEERLVETYGKSLLDCELYKVGHHGSSTSSSEELLDAMTPTYAVISSGAGNSYGHPHGTTIAKLEEREIEIYRTDRSGDLVFLTDGERFFPLSRD